MPPVKIEIPASTPRDLRDEFAGLLEQLGPVQDLTAKSFNMDTAMLILAGISATADVLDIAARLIDWRDKARRRSVRLDKVTIIIGEQRINLQNTDIQTLIRLLENLRDT